ncbi:MAG: hypothetical protein IPM94_12265 [bacterium]|nr:hypothetical protein [bacterium]
MTLVVGGCTTYRSVRLPDAPDQAPTGDPRPTIRAGNLVRVTLANGDTLSGEVWRVSPDELAVGIVANHAVEERVVPRQDIQALEECGGTEGANFVMGVFGTLMVGTIALVIWLGTVEWGPS